MTDVQAQKAPGRVSQRAPINAPNRIGRYRLENVIGGGTTGLVYKAFDDQFDRPVAIKTLQPNCLAELTASRDGMRRFAAEMGLAARCLHPNVAIVLDYLEEGGAPYIVREYFDAGTLEHLIRSGALPPLQQVGEIMAQLLLALSHALSKGVIHGNVKPAKIFCPSAASIKVADFGIAPLLPIDPTRLDPDSCARRLEYQAPERLGGAPTCDARSDLFSAGIILFELLTGKKPFESPEGPEQRQKRLGDVSNAMRFHRPDVGLEIGSLAQRALAPHPMDRFQSAEEFVDALNRAIEAGPFDNVLPLDLARLSRPAAAEASTASRRLDQPMAAELSPVTIDALGRLLANSLGPIARILVKRASLEATSADMLLTALADQITIKAEAQRFRREGEQLLRGSGRALAKGDRPVSGRAPWSWRL
jgi:eukaryotic-like serine/threonine-protein kinase